MPGLGRVGWEEPNPSLVLLAEARGLPGGRAAEPRGVGWTQDPEGAEGLAPKGWWTLGFLVATEEAPGGFWGSGVLT